MCVPGSVLKQGGTTLAKKLAYQARQPGLLLPETKRAKRLALVARAALLFVSVLGLPISRVSHFTE
jgi:hypothetical protein